MTSVAPAATSSKLANFMISASFLKGKTDVWNHHPKQETKWSWCPLLVSSPYPFNWNTSSFSHIYVTTLLLVLQHQASPTHPLPCQKPSRKTPWFPVHLWSKTVPEARKSWCLEGIFLSGFGVGNRHMTGVKDLYIYIYIYTSYHIPDNIYKKMFRKTAEKMRRCLGTRTHTKNLLSHGTLGYLPSWKRPAESFKTRGLKLKPFELLAVCLIP